jgi:hypothetical protein
VRRLRVSARRSIAALALILLPLIGTSVAGPKSRVTREYDLKAAFLFNFAQFVEWPQEAFPDAATPITIGILGEDPFGKSLDEMVDNEVIRKHKLVVRRYRDVKEASGCHILFIGSASKTDVDRILSRLEGKSILTVGETEEFTARSGIIRFVMVDKRVRVKINVEAARAAGLTISSKLLRQAEIVDTGSGR